MNGSQKTVIICGIVALLATLAFCPWARYSAISTDSSVSTTPSYDPEDVYHPIFAPPPPRHVDYKALQVFYHVSLDYGRLGAEWVVILLATVGLVFVFMERKSAKDVLAHASRTSFIGLAGPQAQNNPNKPSFDTDLDAAPPPAFARDDDQVE